MRLWTFQTLLLPSSPVSLRLYEAAVRKELYEGGPPTVSRCRTDFKVFDEADAAVDALKRDQCDAADAAELRASLARLSQEFQSECRQTQELEAECRSWRQDEALQASNAALEASRRVRDVDRLEAANAALQARLAEMECDAGDASEAQAACIQRDQYAEERRLLLKLAGSPTGLAFLRVLAEAQLPSSPAAQHLRFCEQSAARNVAVSEASALARRENPGKPWDGLVLSQRQIPVFAQGHYFAVRIAEIDSRFTGGLGIGVTAQRIEKPQSRCPAAASEMPGFVGVCCYYGGQLRRRGRFYPGSSGASGSIEPLDCDWKPQELVAGDEVGLLSRPDGAVDIFVNGRRRLHVMEAGAPSCAGRLYAVIDILSHVVAVQAIEAAAPPISCADLQEDLRMPAPVSVATAASGAAMRRATSMNASHLPPIHTPRQTGR